MNDTQDKATADRLRAALPRLPKSDQSFANSLIAAFDQYGSWTPGRRTWANKLLDRVGTAAQNIGDLAGIMSLFEYASKHVKRPSLELAIPGYPADRAVHLSVAGMKSKFPGTLTLATSQKTNTSGEWPQREWLGRIMKDGSFVASDALLNGQRMSDGSGFGAAVIDKLKWLAQDPAKIAGEDGRLLGRCCFCRGALSDERSTLVGYGRRCAYNFGLDWGERPMTPVLSGASAEQQGRI